MESQLKIDHGYSFPFHMRILGGILMVLGVFLPYFSFWTIILLVPGWFLLITRSFTALNDNLSQVIKVNDYRLFKKRTVYSLKDYPDVSILKRRMSRSTFGGRTMVAVTENLVLYDVVLLSENHWKKLVIDRFSSVEEAKVLAVRISELFSRNFTPYRPQQLSGMRRPMRFSRIKK
jgi:hypothetical protein